MRGRSDTRTSLSRAAVLLPAIGVALGIVGCRSKVANEAARSPKDTAAQLGVETPDLEGPDPLELAPLVAVTGSGLAFDHEPVDGAGLAGRLRTYRANFPILHPGEPAPRNILLACSPAVPSGRVFSAFEIASPMGFDRALLVFERTRSSGPDSVGKDTPTITAARVSVGADTASENQGRRIRASDVKDCAQLSEQVIASRRAGLPVLLVLPLKN